MSDLDLAERTAQLDAIAAEIRTCTLCGLAQGRSHAVPGDGPYTADIMFIGEGPGFNEDQQGKPFVGPSGRFLNELLKTIALDRSQVFITNVVRCRPPENRDPLPDEVSICTKTYLYRQIDLINPKVIVTLGRISMGLFFPGQKITPIHGQVKWEGNRAYLPMFHPAAILRNMGLKPQAEADMAKLPGIVEEAKRRALENPDNGATGGSSNGGSKPAADQKPRKPDPPSQLSLF